LDDDHELWERICRGDSAALEGFYRENGARLRNFLRQLLGNTQTAEDVMQETLLQLWRKPNGFHPENGTLRCYVFGIGRRRAADWWRQFKPVIGSRQAAVGEVE
jgi:RNA polymerase sigma factor (sigma-70 family)